MSTVFAGAGFYAWYKWTLGDPRDLIVAILKRRVGYLKIEHPMFDEFATDYLNDKNEYVESLIRLSVISWPLQFLTPYEMLPLAHPVVRLEDSTVSKYLLSTDFFHYHADEQRDIKFIAYYDPYNAPCRYPFLPKKTPNKPSRSEEARAI